MRSFLLVCCLLAFAGTAYADGVEIRGPLQTGTRVAIGKVEGIILRVTDDGVYVKVNRHDVEDSDDPETVRLVELYENAKWDHQSVLLYLPANEFLGEGSVASAVRVRVSTQVEASFDRKGEGGWSRETGTLLAFRESALGFLSDDARTPDDTSWVSVDAVSKVEVATSKSSHRLEGAAIGLGLGALLGVGVTAAYIEISGDEEGVFLGLLAVPIGAGVGLIAGGIIGGQIKSDDWDEVSLDQLREEYASLDGPVMLGFRVRF